MQLEIMAASPPPQHARAPAGAASGRPPVVGPALAGTRLADLHPASWVAAAWYPVYRIPDAPLTARFLVFYSLGAVRQLLDCASAGGSGAPVALSELRLPIIGFKWCDLGGEHWFERGPSRGVQRRGERCGACRVGGSGGPCGSSSNSSSRSSSSSGNDAGSEASSTESGGSADQGDAAWAWSCCSRSGGEGSSGECSTAASRGRCSGCAAGTHPAPCGGASSCSESSCWSPVAAARGAAGLRDALSRLQGSAERLARGWWLELLDPAAGPRPFRLYHSDFEWFQSRCAGV